jgi:hypothetical protein
MSQIDDWIQDSEADLHIDYHGNLGEQASTNYKNFTKWLTILKKHAIELKKLQLEESKLSAELWLYYTGKAEPQVYRDRPMDNRYLKSEVKEAISMDPDMMKLRLRISIMEEAVDTLERIVKAVKDRDWAIKAGIEWRRFESGI